MSHKTTSTQPMRAGDFDFNGPLGSEDACIAPVGRNRFQVVLGHAPNRPDRPNQLQFTLRQHARGNPLTLDVLYQGRGRGFNTFFVSYSYDLEHWRPTHWEKGARGPEPNISDTVHFPPFEQDTVYVGDQVPICHDMLERMIRAWTARPDVQSTVIGHSLGGRPIYRLTIHAPDPGAGPPLRHYIAAQHNEHNAQWRAIGMIQWLLSEQGSAFRRDHVCDFVIMVGPDGPAKGWQCLNAEGADLQRWRAEHDDGGADTAGYGPQPHESWVAQQDFEAVMQHQAYDTVWSMHTWQGMVEPMIIPGEWLDKRTSGTWQDLRRLMLKHDRRGLCKPLKPAEIHDKVYKSWGHGPWQKYGVTSIGCEGGGGIWTRADNLESGRVLIRAFAEYCERFGVPR